MMKKKKMMMMMFLRPSSVSWESGDDRMHGKQAAVV